MVPEWLLRLFWLALTWPTLNTELPEPKTGSASIAKPPFWDRYVRFFGCYPKHCCFVPWLSSPYDATEPTGAGISPVATCSPPYPPLFSTSPSSVAAALGTVDVGATAAAASAVVAARGGSGRM